MDNLAVCQPVEIVFVDPTRLFRLARERGVPRAEFILGVALEEIAERLSAADAAWRAGEVTRLAKIARSLVGLSGELGLQTLSGVSAQVAEVAETGDGVTLAAVVTRLVRVGDHSLSAVGDLGHLRL